MLFDGGLPGSDWLPDKRAHRSVSSLCRRLGPPNVLGELRRILPGPVSSSHNSVQNRVPPWLPQFPMPAIDAGGDSLSMPKIQFHQVVRSAAQFTVRRVLPPGLCASLATILFRCRSRPDQDVPPSSRESGPIRPNDLLNPGSSYPMISVWRSRYNIRAAIAFFLQRVVLQLSLKLSGFIDLRRGPQGLQAAGISSVNRPRFV